MSNYKTPLRYPGGKQKLAPFIREVIEANSLAGGHYAEPYAGGAGVAMELLLNGSVSHVHLNDSSKAIYAFWYSILNHTRAFCRRVASASLTVVEWRRQKEILSRPSEFDVLDLGYSLFFLNRCNRSGIPSGGVIGGLAQTGKWKIDARFPRNRLITRIEAIAAKKKLITLKNWDAEKFILKHIPTLPKKSLVYCDPPYFHKASRLYLNHYKPGDHARIASVIQRDLVRPWIVSYDGVQEILGFYAKRRSFLYDLQYNAGRAYKGREVFVFSDDLILPSESVIPSVNVALMLANP
jgi:DNA adenine methylase